MEQNILIRGMETDPATEKEFVELDPEFTVLWAREFGKWALGLEQALKDCEGCAPFRARAMTEFVRSGYHKPVRGLNYHEVEVEDDDLQEAKKATGTLVDNLS